MTQFYSRYVPPVKSSVAKDTTTHSSIEKRKRNDNTDEPERNNDGGKRRKVLQQDSLRKDKREARSPAAEKKQTIGTTNGKSILDKYRVTHQATSQREDVDIALGAKQHKSKQVSAERSTNGNVKQSMSTLKPIAVVPSEKDENAENRKHTDVLRKYDKSRRSSQRKDGENEIIENTSNDGQSLNEITRDLIPIPQPEDVEIVPKEPTYSTLASWQATATKVQSSGTTAFTDLGVSGKLLSNLQSRGIQSAFPVQSAVIPFLLKGDHHYRGDICVSAATGSGKTLAYVVPVVERLRNDQSSGLRAVIVVPTRELVKQVRETCEMCAAGFNLKIVTALGSKSMLEEQKSLIEEEDVFDPIAYEQELTAPIDWATFSLEKTLLMARNRDVSKTINHVRRASIKADILITTPGRLVDHLQNTDGFHLDDVKWLVVDEADRLLNESYQDWIDVVVPALQLRNATKNRDKILSHMRMDLPVRVVRKILLSATMTRDISKLNHIGLDNPKLVVLESANVGTSAVPVVDNTDGDERVATDISGHYTLPALLSETAVTFKEDTEKPLVLLQLLEKYTSILIDKRKRETSGLSKTLKSGQSSHSSSDASLDSSSDSNSNSNSSLDSESDSDTDSSDSESSGLSDSTSSSGDSDQEQQLPGFHSAKHGMANSTTAQSVTRSLIFTRSTASASRLSRLISILSPNMGERVATLTRSANSSASSRKALSTFRNGKTPILIATDRASRGIDVPGLEHVISYDIPGSALTYTHRVGRTARAGREGHAWTMVEHREGRWFWAEIGGKSKDGIIERSQKVRRLNVEVDDEQMKKKYEGALQVLGSEVRGD